MTNPKSLAAFSAAFNNAMQASAPEPAQPRLRSASKNLLYQAPVDPSQQPLVTKETLASLLQKSHATEKLDGDVEDLLLEMAADFVKQSLTQACILSKHRKSTILEVKDVQLPVQKKFGITIPGYHSPSQDSLISRSRTQAKSQSALAHASRIHEVKEAKQRGKSKHLIGKK
jgi:transcription initiation factor TFIID subunit TAF12